MFHSVLMRMRELVRTRRYVIALHAIDEMINDDLVFLDVASCISAGEIVARQFDPERDHWKYLIEGPSLAGEPFITVARIGPRDMLFIITVYAL